MEGGRGIEGGWDEEYEEAEEYEEEEEEGGGGNEGKYEEKGRSREGKWESGKGRCAVTGRRVLAGTDGLRRVMV